MNPVSNHYFMLIIIGFIGLSCSCAPSDDPLRINQVQPDWFVGIFFQLHQNTSKIDYEFKCIGALVSRRIVAVSALCVPMGFKDVITVRFYDWMQNKNITKHVAYEENFVSDILDFQKLYPGDVGKNDVNLLILSEPTKRNSFIKLRNNSNFAPYSEYFESHYYVKNCFFVDTKGDMHSGYDIKFLTVRTMKKIDCCKKYHYSGRFDENVNDLCRFYLFEIDCFKINDDDNQAFIHYNPLVCENEKLYNNFPYLHGFFLNKDDNLAKFSTFHENKAWISETLPKYP